MSVLMGDLAEALAAARVSEGAEGPRAAASVVYEFVDDEVRTRERRALRRFLPRRRHRLLGAARRFTIDLKMAAEGGRSTEQAIRSDGRPQVCHIGECDLRVQIVLSISPALVAVIV